MLGGQFGPAPGPVLRRATGGAALLTHLVERVHARTHSVAVTSRLEIGSPADLLVGVAAGMGLLVVGSAHGRVAGVVGGSVCAHAAAHHAGTVMVVRMPAWPPGPKFAARPVIVGVDRTSDAAVVFGIEEARLRGGDLVLLHATGGDSGLDTHVAGAGIDAVSGVIVQHRSVDGPAWRALAEASLHAGAVVIGRHRRGALSKLLLGSVGQRLIREASCPVFIAR